MCKSLVIHPQILDIIFSAPQRKREKIAYAVLVYSMDESANIDPSIAYEFSIVKPIIDKSRRISESRKGAAKARWGKNDFASNLHMQNSCKSDANGMRNDANGMQTSCKTDAKTSFAYAKGMQNANLHMQNNAKSSTLKEDGKEESSKEEIYIYNNQVKKESSNEDKKESKVDEAPGSERMTRFKYWLSKECPYISSHYKLPNEKQLSSLIDEFGATGLSEICLNIENRVDLRKRYKDLSRTATNWGRKDNIYKP